MRVRQIHASHPLVNLYVQRLKGIWKNQDLVRSTEKNIGLITGPEILIYLLPHGVTRNTSAVTWTTEDLCG